MFVTATLPLLIAFALGIAVRSAPAQAAPCAPSSFHDTLRFVDSAAHRLNGCDGDIVPFPESESSSEWVHTRLRVVPAGTQPFRFAFPSPSRVRGVHFPFGPQGPGHSAWEARSST